jgi:hypothetical protein
MAVVIANNNNDPEEDEEARSFNNPHLGCSQHQQQHQSIMSLCKEMITILARTLLSLCTNPMSDRKSNRNDDDDKSKAQYCIS